MVRPHSPRFFLHVNVRWNARLNLDDSALYRMGLMALKQSNKHTIKTRILQIPQPIVFVAGVTPHCVAHLIGKIAESASRK
jgi:hypothetical protein